MAFKSVKDYNEEKYNGLFILQNDGDTADVIFMYQSENDALIADTHYIKSDDYNGYVHCTGRGCPACEKGIRVQTKLFIPLFNINKGTLEIWDRSRRFESQLQQDVFSRYPNPSEFVFRITRHGAAGSIDTSYEIMAVGRNTYMSFAEICAKHQTSFPDFYETVCRDMSPTEMRRALSAPVTGGNVGSPSGLPDYQVMPRTASTMARVSPESVAEPPQGEPSWGGIPTPDGFNDEDDDLPPSTPAPAEGSQEVIEGNVDF